MRTHGRLVGLDIGLDEMEPLPYALEPGRRILSDDGFAIIGIHSQRTHPRVSTSALHVVAWEFLDANPWASTDELNAHLTQAFPLK